MRKLLNTVFRINDTISKLKFSLKKKNVYESDVCYNCKKHKIKRSSI